MLKEYEQKRDFARSPEPPPTPEAREGPLLFVVQKHAARRLHYDFRLELDGALKSWSIPGGPSLDPKTKRLAVMVEDHPLDYASFEGVIPKGEYGAGQVIVWDSGTYSPEKDGETFFHDRARAQELMREALAKGKISFILQGHKLKGSWTLVKMRGKANDWLFIKHQDEHATAERDVLSEESSVVSGLSIADLKAGHLPAPPAAAPVSLADIPGSRQAPLPTSLAPMLATLTDAPFTDSNWLFEPKLDGYRTIAFISDGKVKLSSRRQLNVTDQYPFMATDLKQQPAKELVLDGEIVALDDLGRSCFQCLQQHRQLTQSGRLGNVAIQIVYYVFDILYLDGYDLRDIALQRRRKLLEQVLRPTDHVRLVEQFAGDGQKVYEAAIAIGLEGIMAKRQDSIYEAGRRSRSWLKIKAVLSDEFVIGGYTQGTGNRAGSFGALLLGYYDDKGKLVYAGHVGSGFDDATLTDLRARLEALQTEECPFAEPPPRHAPTIWLKPELVAEVKFAQWTQEGYLRSPVFLRLCEDKPAAEVRRVPTATPPTSTSPKSESVVAAPLSGELTRILGRIQEGGDTVTITIEGHQVSLSNLDKEFFPATPTRPALTKRDFLAYLAKVSPYLLPHLRDRPLTLTRYPDGIREERFYQKHWTFPLPGFVRSVRLFSEHEEEWGEYLLCDNLATLLWLGQLADLELHTWFSRLSPEPDLPALSGDNEADIDYLSRHPDFIIFDLDPYIFSGHEPKGAEPELNRTAFARVSEIALRLKGLLDSLSLSSFVKTSGRTGLHIHVPILRQFDYREVRSAAGTIGRFLVQQYPKDVTMDWNVERRTGKVFLDYNQNVRGKTLASVYSPRPTAAATVSTPLAWDELGRVYPTDFTILTVPDHLEKVGDLWKNILEAKRDLQKLLAAGK